MTYARGVSDAFRLPLAVLVLFLLLVAQRPPHFTQLFADLAKLEIRVILLDLVTVFLAKEHESRQRLLRSALLFGGLSRVVEFRKTGFAFSGMRYDVLQKG